MLESKPGALCAIGEHTPAHLCPGYRPRLGLAFLSSGARMVWLLLLLCILGCVQLTLTHSVPWLWLHTVHTWGLSSTVRIVFESKASWIDHCCPVKPSILSWFMGIVYRLVGAKGGVFILESEMSGHGCEERQGYFYNQVPIQKQFDEIFWEQNKGSHKLKPPELHWGKRQVNAKCGGLYRPQMLSSSCDWWTLSVGTFQRNHIIVRKMLAYTQRRTASSH